jgi:hypothetical protein
MSRGRAIRMLGPSELDEDTIVATAVRARAEEDAAS